MTDPLFDAALIPLMSETEQLRLDFHPTHTMLAGHVVRRDQIRWSEKRVIWPREQRID